MSTNSEFEIEYLKSLYRCPICSTLVGSTDDGVVDKFDYRAFRRHVENCRRNYRVKPNIEKDRK
jgi:hypothetical protein